MHEVERHLESRSRRGSIPARPRSGLVAPITERAAGTASSPSSTIATSGPRVMNSISSGKNGLLACSCVVLLGEVAVDLHQLQRGDPQALALEAGDHLAGQAALEGVGLHEDQGPDTCAGRLSVGRWLRRRSAAGFGGGSSRLVEAARARARSRSVAPDRARRRRARCAPRQPLGRALGARARAPRCAGATRDRRRRCGRRPRPRSTGTPASAGRAACRSCGTAPSACACRAGSAGSWARPRCRSCGRCGSRAARAASRPP